MATFNVWAIVGRSFVIVFGLTTITGCAFQTKIIQNRHWDLNETVRVTKDEQLLLNIVRLRYDEVPYFLQMASITTSFTSSASAGVSGTIPENGSNVLGVNAGASYSETPTVTWALPDSSEFLGRLYAPMGADQLSVLSQSGLDLGLVLRIGVKKLNRLRNLEFSLTDGLYTPPSYQEFLEAITLLDELRKEDLVDIAYGVYITKAGGDIARDAIDTQAMADALEYGVQFMTLDDPDVFQMLKLSRPAFVRFSKAADDDPRARRLRDLLDLNPEMYTFAIIDVGSSSKETLQAAMQQITPSRDGDAPLPEILLNNRSVMEVLRFASAYVEVPPEDLAAGVVRDRTAPERSWLHIRSSAKEPEHAWIKIKKDDSWYYIADDDLDSRISFTLLSALFSSVVGDVPGAKPLLTLPVR